MALLVIGLALVILFLWKFDVWYAAGVALYELLFGSRHAIDWCWAGGLPGQVEDCYPSEEWCCESEWDETCEVDFDDWFLAVDGCRVVYAGQSWDRGHGFMALVPLGEELEPRAGQPVGGARAGLTQFLTAFGAGQVHDGH